MPGSRELPSGFARAVDPWTCARGRRARLRHPVALFSVRPQRRRRPLAAVLEHNRLDLLSLALLTARAAQLLEDGAAAARTAREAYRPRLSVPAWRALAGRPRVLCAGGANGRGSDGCEG